MKIKLMGSSFRDGILWLYVEILNTLFNVPAFVGAGELGYAVNRDLSYFYQNVARNASRYFKDGFR